MEKSGIFNSVNGDRKYKAQFFAEYFSSFIGNGVFPNPSTNLQVIANDDMTVTLKAGRAWINGYIYINTDDLILPIDFADGALNRIDKIVLKYNTVEREITAKVKKGTFASSPAAPDLQRDDDAYELGLADIYIDAGIVSISQSNITDLRLDTEKCGIVHGTIDQIDTTTLLSQYQAWLTEKKNQYDSDIVQWKEEKQSEYQTWYDTTTANEQGEIDNMQIGFKQDWDTWFNNIKDVFDGDTAGQLLSLINQNEMKINEVKDAMNFNLQIMNVLGV